MKLILNPERRQLRQFAWVCLFFFPGLAFFLSWKYGLPVVWFGALVALGVVVAVVELVLVDALGGAVGTLLQKLIPRSLYQLLTLLAFPIGFVLSHLLMALIYYLLITPMGLFFRLVGRDVMGKRPDPKMASYWHDRGPARSPASYFKLY